jgi:hypothetical protein
MGNYIGSLLFFIYGIKGKTAIEKKDIKSAELNC